MDLESERTILNTDLDSTGWLVVDMVVEVGVDDFEWARCPIEEPETAFVISTPVIKRM